MLKHSYRKITSILLTSLFSVALLFNNSCVQYTNSSYDEITRDLKTYSPTVTIKQNNGDDLDLQVTEITDNDLIGYTTHNESFALSKIPKSSITSLMKKNDTNLTTFSKKTGKVIVIGIVGTIVIATHYVYDK